MVDSYPYAGIILGMGSSDEVKSYYVTPSLIGRAPIQNDPWCITCKQWFCRSFTTNVVRDGEQAMPITDTLFHQNNIMVHTLNSLAPRRSQINFREVHFKLILVIDDWGISGEIVLTLTPQDLTEIVLTLTPQDLTDDKSILVQVVAWCRQATIHYRSQCWHSYPPPYGVARPQWVDNDAANSDTANAFACVWLR